VPQRALEKRLRSTSAAPTGQTLCGTSAKDIALRQRSLPHCSRFAFPENLEAAGFPFSIIGLNWLQKRRMKHMI
jgi:hypothetical protein